MIQSRNQASPNFNQNIADTIVGRIINRYFLLFEAF